MRRILVPCLLLALALTASTAAPAEELAGVKLADSVDVQGESLVLNGLGLRKKIGFKVYVGGLYLRAKSSDAEAILAADEPRRTDMVFMRGVSAKQLCGAWSDCLDGNAPGASDELKAGFDELCGMMEDVKKGDHLIATYVPGTGSEIEIKGTSQGTIAGKDFADTLFACWIGEKPATADLKRGMLGQ